MSTHKKHFVGFGFGPIQSGLFGYEAYASGNFSRFVVAEIDADLVAAVRDNGGRYTVNIARKSGIDRAELTGIELYNPQEPADRETLIDAIGDADELATALPSVNIYTAGGDNSVIRLLTDGLAGKRKPRILYAAENNNHAAEILIEHLGQRSDLDVLNTVIGKMSGVITDAATMERMGLEAITPDIPRAILVEEFNRILVSRVKLPGATRGIEVFIEKDDLLPFEEAKLYGHNAIHAMIAYLADLKHYATIADAGQDEAIMTLAREAFIDESGATLIRRHETLDDPLFTPAGYRDYADDLLERMINPNLNDLVARVGRDHLRKLGYDDRLFGTMHLALEYDVVPAKLALGAAAGVVSMVQRQEELQHRPGHLPATADELTEKTLTALLMDVWGEKTDDLAEPMIALTWRGLETLRRDTLV